MVRVRLQTPPPPRPRRPRPAPPVEDRPTEAPARTAGGLSERQWVISLLVVSGLLLLITFRGCVLPTGVGPKQKPASELTNAPAAAPQGDVSEYTVEAGDTAGSIASKFGVSVDALLEANGLTRQSILSVGQKLKIPK